MYLERTTYVKNWDHSPEEDRYQISIKKGGKKFKSIDPTRITNITEEVMYWRKANAIHNWFVQNCQGGVDECQRTEVSREKLQALLDACKAVKENPKKVADLLPPTSGFFFGSTDVDQYYWQDIDDTITRITKELARTDESRFGATFYYQSSW